MSDAQTVMELAGYVKELHNDEHDGPCEECGYRACQVASRAVVGADRAWWVQTSYTTRATEARTTDVSESEQFTSEQEERIRALAGTGSLIVVVVVFAVMLVGFLNIMWRLDALEHRVCVTHVERGSQAKLCPPTTAEANHEQQVRR